MLLSRGSESDCISETAVAALRTDKEVAFDGEKELLENIVDLRGEERRADEPL